MPVTERAPYSGGDDGYGRCGAAAVQALQINQGTRQTGLLEEKEKLMWANLFETFFAQCLSRQKNSAIVAGSTKHSSTKRSSRVDSRSGD